MFQLVAVICYLKVFRHQELLTMTLFLHQEAKFSASLNFILKHFTLFFSILTASLSQVEVISISAWKCMVQEMVLGKKNSVTGNRTRATWVRARYPNH